MSIFNDHRRCLEILDSDDTDKRKLVENNIANIKMTFGKHKGKTFRDIFFTDAKYVWWVNNKASLDTSTLKLFKKYCDSNKTDSKTIKPILKVYTEKGYKIPPVNNTRVYKQYKQREAFCRLCDYIVDVKETFSGDECSVCGYAFRS